MYEYDHEYRRFTWPMWLFQITRALHALAMLCGAFVLLVLTFLLQVFMLYSAGFASVYLPALLALLAMCGAIVLDIVLMVQLGNRSSSFLVVLFARLLLSLVPGLAAIWLVVYSGSETFLWQFFLVAFADAIINGIWLFYFRYSVRMRTFMKSDAYLAGPFKNGTHPAPAVPDPPKWAFGGYMTPGMPQPYFPNVPPTYPIYPPAQPGQGGQYPPPGTPYGVPPQYPPQYPPPPYPPHGGGLQ